MSETYNIYEAKTHFSRLLERASNGVDIRIAKAGKPRWKIVPMSTLKPKRVPGKLKGKLWIASDAFSPEVDARIAADFYASPLFPPKKKPRKK
jgi:antitoxin (DNA-binding transcriptional repressor) of toxin-antitoxin stability system